MEDMHPYNIVCPTCGAALGRSCINAWGYAVAQYHQSRIDAAKAGA